MKRIRFEWGKQNTARLIKLFKEQEVLWDRTNINYNNKVARETAYSAILNDLQVEDVLPDDATIFDLRSKINSIRSGHLKARASNLRPWFYDMMYFLRGEPNPETVRTGSNARDHMEKLYEVDSNEEKDSKWKKKELVLKLLEFYKQQPVLWNPNNPHYKNKMKREQANKKIAQQLSISDITARDVYKKIWALRRTYKSLLRRRIPADHAVPFWFESMHFIKDIRLDEISGRSQSHVTHGTNSEVEDNGNDFEANNSNVDDDDNVEYDANTIASKKSEKKITSNSSRYLKEEKDKTFEKIMIENLVQMPKTSNRKNFAKSLITPIDKITVLTNRLVDVNKLAEKKFDRLVKEMISTINCLHDEETIYDLINYMQKLLKEAQSSDKLVFRPKEILKEFQERKTLASEESEEASWDPLDMKKDDVFEIKLTFRAQDDAQHIFKAISQLPDLEHIQLTGSNFHTAVTLQKEKH